MHVIACAHATTHTSTLATSLMHVKIKCATSVYDTYCLGHWNDENEETKTSKLTADHFSLTLFKVARVVKI